MLKSILTLVAAALGADAADSAPTGEPARARANLTALFSDADYPAAAIAAREQGTVEFMLEVAATGLVQGCTVTGSSGSEALDSATCGVLAQRARFTPARGPGGIPVPDRVKGRVRWLLPAAPPPAG
ncbi:MAG TPA: TonB family protein [Allosphingosinicella sp.]|jgi:protein TonB